MFKSSKSSFEPSLIKPTKKRVKEIRKLASKYFFTKVSDAGLSKNGAICTIYNDNTIMCALRDNLSVGIMDRSKRLLGYLIILKFRTFETAFGVTMDYELSDYSVDINNNSAYLLQTCLDESIQRMGAYSSMLNHCIHLCEMQRISYIYTEIMKQNSHSQKVHLSLGWVMLDEIPPLSPFEIKGINDRLMRSLGAKPEDKLSWMLFIKKII